MANVEFYICNHCKNIITKVNDSGVNVVCCGEDMHKLVPNTSDGAGEKHVPSYKIDGTKVEVVIGSVLHPATVEHHIQFIALETENDLQIHWLKPTEEPKTVFYTDQKVKAIYEYCNLHGLWKVEL